MAATIAEQEQLVFFKAKASRYAFYGVMIAAASAIFATLLVSYMMQGAISVAGVITGQRRNIALRILDIMPFVFAAWGQYASQRMTKVATHVVSRHTRGLRAALSQAHSDSRAKSDFFSKMSHELRTPLNGILGTSELLAGTAMTDEQRRYVRVVQSSAQSLLSVLNDLLDFSKIEAGRLKLEQVQFDLRECLEAPVLLLEQQARIKGLSLQADIDPVLSSPLLGDPGRLRQILMNLVSNAIKFTHRGGIQVAAKRVWDGGDRCTVRLTVADSGIGINQEEQLRLFQPYVQAKSSTAREYGGTGLGLAISKELAEIMGGHIGVQSAEGHGSTFWLEIPFKKGTVTDSEPIERTLQGMRVLVADALTGAESWVGAHLRSLGMEVEQTADGHYARARLAEAAEQGQPFDLALVDMFLPGMNGETLGSEIKAAPALRTTVLIMLTSAGQRGDALRARELGFSAYLTRPLSKHLLTSAITRAMARKNRGGNETGLITKYSLGVQSPRVLFVEDSAINREIALHALAPCGYLLTFASDGVEGIAAAAEHRYDLLLVDLQMPVVDGLKATQAIRALPNAKDQGPIVVLTAGTTEEVRNQCIAAGAIDVIIKPPGADALVGIVERFLKPPSAAPALHRPTEDPAFIQIFIQEADGRMQSLREAFTRGEREVVVRQAHTLKSAGRHLSATAFSETASKIESLAHAGRLGDAQLLAPDLEQHYLELRSHILG